MPRTARQELEHSRTEAELQNLKSQLNPHFLFNTLNNIYSLIQIDVDRAQRSVHELSSLLRYVLYDSSRPTVPLKAEMDFLGNYIELMRIRLPRHVRVFVSLPEKPSPDARRAAALHLAGGKRFQARRRQRPPSCVSIDIHEEEGRLVCRIRNSCFPKSGDSTAAARASGLRTFAKRLEMIYPGRYTFEYGQAGDAYQALLCIELPDE